MNVLAPVVGLMPEDYVCGELERVSVLSQSEDPNYMQLNFVCECRCNIIPAINVLKGVHHAPWRRTVRPFLLCTRDSLTTSSKTCAFIPPSISGDVHSARHPTSRYVVTKTHNMYVMALDFKRVCDYHTP